MIRHLLLGALALAGAGHVSLTNPSTPVAELPRAQRKSFDTDTIFQAGRATRFSLESIGGSVLIEGWDRDEIQISAEHSRRTEIEINRSGRTIYVEGEGRPSNIDYVIRLPRGMDVDVEAYRTSITVTDMAGEVEAETFAGDIEIQGGRGTISASSAGGDVLIDGSEASISATSIGGDVSITNSSGPIRAESVGGDILMEDVITADAEAETVGGSVTYRGSLDDNGTYFFGTHGGRITLELDPDTNADLTVSVINGRVRLDFPGATGEPKRNARSLITLGDGGADVEIETFSGPIRIRTRQDP